MILLVPACVKHQQELISRRRIEETMSKHIGRRVTAVFAAVAVPAIVSIVNGPSVQAQSPQAAARPGFEVVSVKRCKPEDSGGGDGKKGGGGGRVRWDPGRLTAECQTVENLVRDAYLSYPDGKPWAAAGFVSKNVPVPPISDRLFRQPPQGSPAWVTSERYTIDAKTEGPASQEMMRGPMMQALLEDRFKLKIHRASREVPVYELTMVKGGAKLQPYQEGSCVPLDLDHLPPLPGPGQEQVRLCGMFLHGKKGGTDVNGTTFASLCRLLSNISDRDVIDRTGITGLFDIHFDTRPEGQLAVDPAGQSDPETLARLRAAAERAARFNELERALPRAGLKLEPGRAPGEFLVIDHVERPSSN
jgi:uncharacterized protein (TIGR03435 family)